jgi:hypothetical protein
VTDVYLAPGHGRRPNGSLDPGASGGGTTEQAAGDQVARAVEQQLRAVYGRTVTRQPRGGPNFAGTITEIQRLAPRVAIELHHDWSGAPRGGFGFAANAEQRRLCEAIAKHYRAEGLPTRAHLTNLPGSSSPPAISRATYPRGTTVVLWEVDRIGAPYPLAAVARAIADGIASYRGWRPAAPTPPPAPPAQEDEMTPAQERLLAKAADDAAAALALVRQIDAKLGTRAGGRVLDDLGRLRRDARRAVFDGGLAASEDEARGSRPAGPYES